MNQITELQMNEDWPFKIPLSGGMFTLVDEEDFHALLSEGYSWCLTNKYASRGTRIGGRSKIIYLHRHLLKAQDGEMVDHRNGNKLDNRKDNLRLAKMHQNNQNVGLKKSNTSGLKGVCWYKQTKKWHAQIRFNGSRLHIGFFSSKEEAKAAYDKKANELHGEFARLS